MNKDEIITKTIEEWISKNILKDYLKEHESEVRSMIDMEAEQEFATRCYGKEMFNDGKAEGIAVGKAEGIAVGKAEGIAVGKAEGREVGKAEGITYAIVNLVKKGLLSVNDAAKELNMTENELKKLII